MARSNDASGRRATAQVEGVIEIIMRAISEGPDESHWFPMRRSGLGIRRQETRSGRQQTGVARGPGMSLARKSSSPAGTANLRQRPIWQHVGG